MTFSPSLSQYKSDSTCCFALSETKPSFLNLRFFFFFFDLSPRLLLPRFCRRRCSLPLYRRRHYPILLEYIGIAKIVTWSSKLHKKTGREAKNKSQVLAMFGYRSSFSFLLGLTGLSLVRGKVSTMKAERQAHLSHQRRRHFFFDREVKGIFVSGQRGVAVVFGKVFVSCLLLTAPREASSAPKQLGTQTGTGSGGREKWQSSDRLHQTTKKNNKNSVAQTYILQ